MKSVVIQIYDFSNDSQDLKMISFKQISIRSINVLVKFSVTLNFMFSILLYLTSII